ncbi:MAG TPA: serine/threonine-protein kinase [Polyangiaceae bacterium]|nr:serine/threonine-protein kinase [Polyangiaceae bacterium]
MLQPGALIGGKYRLEKLLGHGAMGMVWAARNERTDRAFAIKFMLPQFARDPTLVQRFFREARVCGRLEHPSLVHIYDLGMAEEAGSVPYMVMELLRGEGLDVVLKRVGRLDPRPAVSLMVGVSGALALAHKAGVVHRDIKPANIFLNRVSQDGEVTAKILDFGISKTIGVGPRAPSLTHVGMLVGTPLYMSPEQARGQRDIDARSDIWGMGVILYQAIAGVAPFNENNYNAVLSAILTHRHKALGSVIPGLPPLLSETIDLCLAKDRNRRLASAEQLAERLEEVMVEFERMEQDKTAEEEGGNGGGVPRLDSMLPRVHAAGGDDGDDEENDETEVMEIENMPPEVAAGMGGAFAQRRKQRKAEARNSAPNNARALRKNWVADLAAMVRSEATDDIAESSRNDVLADDDPPPPPNNSPSTVPPPQPMSETVDLPPSTQAVPATPGPGPGPTFVLPAAGAPAVNVPPARHSPTAPLMVGGNIVHTGPGPSPAASLPTGPVNHSHGMPPALGGPALPAAPPPLGGPGRPMPPMPPPYANLEPSRGVEPILNPVPPADALPPQGRSRASAVRWALMVLLLIIGMGVGAIAVLLWGSR